MPLGVAVLEHPAKYGAVWPVFTLPLFVLHDTALLVQPLLIDRSQQMPHAIGLHPQRNIYGVRGHVLEVVGAIEVGGAVHVGGTDLVERFEVVVVVVLATVEHQVLKQMSKSGFADLLVLRAHVVPDVYRHDRRLVILVDDEGQAVVEHELLERDVDLGQWNGCLLRPERSEGADQHQSDRNRRQQSELLHCVSPRVGCSN